MVTAETIALTEYLHVLRPTWDRPGLLSAITDASQHKPHREVAKVAIEAAYDASAHTPAVIAHRVRTGWHPPTPSVGGQFIATASTCPRCNALLVKGADDDHRCGAGVPPPAGWRERV